MIEKYLPIRKKDKVKNNYIIDSYYVNGKKYDINVYKLTNSMNEHDRETGLGTIRNRY